MHRKTSSISEKLAALRAQASVLIGILYGIVRAGWSRVATSARTRLEGRGVAAGVVAAIVLAAAFVAGTTAILGTATKMDTRSVPALDSDARAALADRASRADRAAGPAPPAPVAPPPPPAWVSPMLGVRLSSCYGPRWGSMHMGIDFAGDNGSPILAVGEGTIFGVGWLYAGYGISVVIDHGNGIFSHYAHASVINVVEGQHVTPGQIIAWEGSTGDSSGPHLHFEIHAGLWNQINPAAWLRDHGVPLGC